MPVPDAVGAILRACAVCSHTDSPSNSLFDLGDVAVTAVLVALVCDVAARHRLRPQQRRVRQPLGVLGGAMAVVTRRALLGRRPVGRVLGSKHVTRRGQEGRLYVDPRAELIDTVAAQAEWHIALFLRARADQHGVVVVAEWVGPFILGRCGVRAVAHGARVCVAGAPRHMRCRTLSERRRGEQHQAARHHEHEHEARHKRPMPVRCSCQSHPSPFERSSLSCHRHLRRGGAANLIRTSGPVPAYLTVMV